MEKLHTLYELYNKVCCENKELCSRIIEKDMKISELEKKIKKKEKITKM
jgi:hypothetical protein